MDWDTKSEQQMEFETKRAAGNSSDREGAGWSRREFLTSSTGLAVAGAIGGLTGSASLAHGRKRADRADRQGRADRTDGEHRADRTDGEH